jgi:tetratricopeptide (TPR) repeat protein
MLSTVGYARSVEGDLAGARAAFAESLTVYSGAGAERAQAAVAANLAEAESRAGDADSALRYAADALALSRALHHMHNATYALYNMAAYFVASSRYDEARSHAREALDLARELQMSSALLWTLQHLAAVAVLPPQTPGSTAATMPCAPRGSWGSSTRGFRCWVSNPATPSSRNAIA